MTPIEIKRLLRDYADYVAELESLGYAFGRAQATWSQVNSVRRSKPVERAVLRAEELWERVSVVDEWLSRLSRVERAAAAYWLKGRPIREIAAELGFELREDEERLHHLAQALPLLIWGRYYDTG